MIPNKACPIILRKHGQDHACYDILAFCHPLAGYQIIKGTIEPGEDPAAAVLRELYEESGIANATIERPLGLWNPGVLGQIWAFYLCATPEPLPDTWQHYTTDGGGHTFTFFWQPITAPLNEAWHPVFVGAINHIRKFLRSTKAHKDTRMTFAALCVLSWITLITTESNHYDRLC